MPSGGNTMRRFETVQRSQFNLSLKLEQHESQSKKSDYQGGQLAQANKYIKQIENKKTNMEYKTNI